MIGILFAMTKLMNDTIVNLTFVDRDSNKVEIPTKVSKDDFHRIMNSDNKAWPPLAVKLTPLIKLLLPKQDETNL